jgi:large subunit ribosomal protein L9
MRVLFLEDVAGVALGGEVKEVKRGFARNYLIPKGLATLATRDALQRVKRLTGQAETVRLKTLTDMRALSEELDGAQVNVEMRAGATGRLYGSVTNAVVAAELSKMTGREMDRRTIEIPESIRDIGKYELRVRLHSEVDATISLLVYPAGTDPAEYAARLEEETEAAAVEQEAAGADDEEAAAAEQEEAAADDEEPAAAEAEHEEAAADDEEPAEAEHEEAAADDEEPAAEQEAAAEAEHEEAAADDEEPAEAEHEEAADDDEEPAEADGGRQR